MTFDFSKQYEVVKKKAGVKWFNETYKPAVEEAVKSAPFKAVALVLEPFGVPYPSYGPGAPDFDFTLKYQPTIVADVVKVLEANGYKTGGDYNEGEYFNKKTGVMVLVAEQDKTPTNVQYISFWMPLEQD